MKKAIVFAALSAIFCLLSAADVEELSFSPAHRHLNNDGTLEVSFDLPTPSSVEKAYLEVFVDGVATLFPDSEMDSGFSYSGNTITIAGSDLYALAGNGSPTLFSRFAPFSDDDSLLSDEEPLPDEDDTFSDDELSPDDDIIISDIDTETPDEDSPWPSGRDGQYQFNLVVVVDHDTITDADVDADNDSDLDSVTDADYVAYSPRLVTTGSETRESFTVTLDNVPPAAPEAAEVEGGNRKLLVTVTPSSKDLLGKSGEQVGVYHVTLTGIFEHGGSAEEATLEYAVELDEAEWDDDSHAFTLEGKDGYALINNDDGDAAHAYQLRIWAEDLAGNSDETRFAEATGSALTTEGFWSHYKRAGGTEKGDYCFVATAGYGDRDHPFVRTLRAWRDAYLAPHETGRTFIAWYYRAGPALGRFVAEVPTARPLTQLLLFPFVLLAWMMLYPLPLLLIATLAVLMTAGRRAVPFIAMLALAIPLTLGAAEKDEEKEQTDKDEKEKKERSVKEKEEEKIEIHGDFLFAFGFYDASNLDKKVSGSPIAEILTSDINLLPMFHFGMDIPAGKHLKLTPRIGIGFVELRGRSVRLDGTPGAERSYFYILPVMGEIKLRPVYEFPVRPYLAAGLDYYFWWILEDRKLAEDGGKFGLHGTVGFQISLNFIDPKTAIRLREATGILDTAIFVHYRLERVDNFFAKKGFDLSSSRFEFGLIFDY